MGIASMVIGIVALITGFIPFCGTWAVAPAVVGLGLGIADLVLKSARKQPRGPAIAGVVLNPLAIAVTVGWYFLFIYGASQAEWQMQQWPQPVDAQDAGPSPFGPQPIPPGWPGQPAAQPGQPLQPMQPMQPMQPVDTAQPQPPDTSAVTPEPVPVLPKPAPTPP